MSFRHLNKMKGVIEKFGGSVDGVDTNGKALDALCGLPIVAGLDLNDVKLKVVKPVEGYGYSGQSNIFAQSPDGFLVEIQGVQGRANYTSDGNWDSGVYPIGKRMTFCGIMCEVVFYDPEKSGRGNLLFAPVDKTYGPIGFTAEQIETIKTTISSEVQTVNFDTKITTKITGVIED